jgi:internalin A
MRGICLPFLLVLAVHSSAIGSPDQEPDERAVINPLEDLGGKFERDAQVPDRPITGVRFTLFLDDQHFAPRHPKGLLSDKDVPLLAGLRNLSHLNLYSPANTDPFNLITDAGLKQIAKLTTLKRLEVCSPGISDDGVQALRSLTNLEELSLSYGEKLTGTGFKELAPLKNLTSLDVWANPLTDAGVAEIGKITSLRKLMISGQITDEGMQGLRGLANLAELRLSSSKAIHATGLSELSRLPKLISLDFTGETDYREDIAEIGRLKNLRRLSLGGPVRDENFNELRSLTNLTDLRLSANLPPHVFNGSGLGELAQLDRLVRLDLWNTSIQDAGLEAIGKIQSLQSLDVSSTGITDAGLVGLCSLKNLTKLNLSGTKIKDLRRAELRNLKSLSELNLAYTQITDASLAELHDLPNLTRSICRTTRSRMAA